MAFQYCFSVVGSRNCSRIALETPGRRSGSVYMVTVRAALSGALGKDDNAYRQGEDC